MGKPSAMGHLTRPTQPFILFGSIIRRPMLSLSVVAPFGECFTRQRQVWCTLQPKNCVIHAWALQRGASHNGALYKSNFLYLNSMTAQHVNSNTGRQNIEAVIITIIPGSNIWGYLYQNLDPDHLQSLLYYVLLQGPFSKISRTSINNFQQARS